MGAANPKAALAAYERACRSHQRKDWRMACHLLAAVVRAQEAAPEPPSVLRRRVDSPKPQPGLLAFLAAHGLRDDGGELRALDAELWHRGKPFQRRLVREDGLSLDMAAERAFEAGYFPDVGAPAWENGDNMHPVTADMLVEAIRRELAAVPQMDEPESDPAYWEALEMEAA